MAGILHTLLYIYYYYYYSWNNNNVRVMLVGELGNSSQWTLSPSRRHPPTPAAFSQPCLVAIATKEV